jgi:hypothetical protein
VKTTVFPVRVDNELAELIGEASRITRLNRSEVTRQSIRLGAAELVRRYRGKRESLAEYLADFRGLEIPKRRYPVKLRSK